ncbi:hypothetical protein CC2G_000074 [Coprinopsis cinerea AmutBmut pab1-1]|nr:hypothetical protein CC2G_000074 [Coprinopsis cinerea AmutBmut pab1-1]
MKSVTGCLLWAFPPRLFERGHLNFEIGFLSFTAFPDVGTRLTRRGFQDWGDALSGASRDEYLDFPQPLPALRRPKSCGLVKCCAISLSHYKAAPP